MDSITIGQRLRRMRGAADLTQTELSGRCGVSVDVIRKLEQDVRISASMPTLMKLADGLGVQLSVLLDKRPRLEKERGREILAVRNALLPLEILPGLGQAPGREPPPLADLEAAVREAWGMYWRGEFGDLAALLPGLLADGRAAEREYAAAGSRPLAQCYQLGADLCVHMGMDDLAGVAAERALRVALRSGDELQFATLAGTVSWTYHHQGRLAEAQQVADLGAARIVPRFRGTPDTEAEAQARLRHLTVHGSLLLSAAAPAAAAGNADAVRDYLGSARLAAAAFTGGDRHDYNTNMGPTQVAMQITHTMAVLGRPAEALRAFSRVRRYDLLPISWGALHLDVAQARLARDDAESTGGAIDALWVSLGVSREWFRQQALAGGLVRAVLDTRQRQAPGKLKKLAAAVGLEPGVSS